MPIISIRQNRSEIPHRLLKDKTGSASIEYALLVALIVVASAALCLSVGVNVSRIWSMVEEQLEVANTSGALHGRNRHKAMQGNMQTSGSTSSVPKEVVAQPPADAMARQKTLESQ